jgi:RNA polymerase sigma-B factor
VQVNPHLGDIEEVFSKYKKTLHSISRKYYNDKWRQKFDYGDFFGQACEAFIKCYERYDPSKFDKPVHFSNYLSRSVSGDIKKLLRDKGHDLHVPRWLKEIGSKITGEEFDGQSPEFIAAALDIPVEKVEEFLDYRIYGRSGSLDAVIYSDEGSSNGDMTLLDVVPDQNQKYFPSYEDIERREEIEEALEVLDKILTKKEKKIFVLSVFEGKPQNEIGEIVGHSQMHISRVLRKSRERLSKYLGREVNVYNGKGKKKGMPRKVDFNVEEAKKMIKETEKSYKEISDETGVNYATVCYHGKRIRGIQKAQKNGKNGPVESRQLTPEERLKYGLDKPKEETSFPDPTGDLNDTLYRMDDKLLVLEPQSPSIEFPVASAAVENPPSLVLHNEDVSIEELQAEFNRVVIAMKTLGVKKVNFSVESA